MNIDAILEELSYRIDTGIVDLSDAKQLAILNEILKEHLINDRDTLLQRIKTISTLLNEAGKMPLDKVLDSTFKNPDTGRNVKVATALGYDKVTKAYGIAKSKLKSSGYSEDDIEMVDADPEDLEEPTNVFGTKGKGTSVFKNKEKSTDKTVNKTPEDENPTGTYDPNNKFQRAVVEAKTPKDLMKALDVMGKNEEDRMLDKQEAGMGGPVASTGETLCVEAQSNLIQGRYNPKKIRESSDYKKEKENLLSVYNGSNKRDKSTLVNELDNIAMKLGYINNDGSTNYDKAISMKAEADLYIKQNLPAFEKTKIAINKFKSKEDMISWMKASFYSSYSLISNGPSDWDRNIGNGRVMKSNQTTDGATFELLQNGLKNSKTSAEKEHYQNQLKVWDKFKGYHDTYLIYANKNGLPTIYHISNKKGDDLKDPQNNTTPETRLINYLEAAKEAGLSPKAAKEVDKAQSIAISGASDNDNIAKNAWNDIQDIDLISSLSNRLPARSQTEVKDEYFNDLKNDREIKNWYKKKYADKWDLNYKSAQTSDVINVAIEIVKNTSDVSKLSNNFTKFLLKQGQLAQSIFSKASSGLDAQKIAESLNDIYSAKEIDAILKSDTMKMLADKKEQHAAGLEGVHTGFINALHKADGTKPGFSGKNGPAVETYVAGTLKSLHIDTYITNYDDNVLIEMGGYGCKPTDLRSCMASLSNFSGEIKTPKGRAALNKHLAVNFKVDADSNAVYLIGSDGKTRTYIASDTWRQAGRAQKVATAFGSDLRNCLKKSVGNRNKENNK